MLELYPVQPLKIRTQGAHIAGYALVSDGCFDVILDVAVLAPPSEEGDCGEGDEEGDAFGEDACCSGW